MAVLSKIQTGNWVFDRSLRKAEVPNDYNLNIDLDIIKKII